MTGSGLSTWPALSGASRPDSPPATPAASYAGGPRPSGCEKTTDTGVAAAGERRRANPKAAVASASLASHTACSFTLPHPAGGVVIFHTLELIG